MYVFRNISPSIVFRFAWKPVLFFLLYATLVVYINHFLDHAGYEFGIPFLPLSTIGIAVAFYLGFKNNSSYDRFWEGRKIWGGIVNYSRTWGNQVLSFIDNKKMDLSERQAIEKELVYRHIAYIHALSLQLRQPTSFSIKHPKSVQTFKLDSPERKHWNEQVGIFLDQEEYCHMIKYKNAATQMIRKQGERLQELAEEDEVVNEFRFMEMMRVLEEFYNLQGKCERIKNTPFPRQYAYFSKLFVWIFILLLPFGLVVEFEKISHSYAFLAIPFSALISWIFYTFEVVGDNSEDPFENWINDVPMTALCRTIEIDLREMLGETSLPEKIKPENGILL